MMRSSTVYHSHIIVIVIIMYYITCGDAVMRCLVSRPGYGLVSEDCPAGTVGCRIRIETDEAIGFYAYSPLYDRNQFVCVLRNELYSGDSAPSGCMRKKYGRVRCWCYGHSNCNTVEEGHHLYEIFLAQEMKASRTSRHSLITTTPELPSVSSVLSSSTIENSSTSWSTTTNSFMNSKTTSEHSLSSTKTVNHDIKTVPFIEATDYNTLTITVTSTSTPTITSTLSAVYRHRPHKQKHRQHDANRKKHRPTDVPPLAIVEVDAHRQRVAPQSMRSEFDAAEGVPVIHVNARDQYDQLIASPEFAGILSRYANDGPAAVPIRTASSWAQRKTFSKEEGLANSDKRLLTFISASARRRAQSDDENERAHHRYYYRNRAADSTAGNEEFHEDVSLEMKPLNGIEMTSNYAAATYGRRNASEPRRRHGTVQNAGKPGELNEFFDEDFFSIGRRPSVTIFVTFALIGVVLPAFVRLF